MVVKRSGLLAGALARQPPISNRQAPSSALSSQGIKAGERRWRGPPSDTVLLEASIWLQAPMAVATGVSMAASVAA